jgi:hypothetical protein
LCGFTWDEIASTFADELSVFGNINDMKEDIVRMYNGYCWTGPTKVFNPHSVCSLLKITDSTNPNNLILKSFWIETGSSSWFVGLMKEVEGRIPAADVWIQEDGFLSSIAVPLNPLHPDFENQLRALMFQAGYLTVNKFKIEEKKKWLYITVPNDEVKNSLLPAVWQSVCGSALLTGNLEKMAEALHTNNLELFFNTLNAEINNIPHKAAQNAANYEGFYQSLLLILLRQVRGIDVSAEIQKISGQLDIRIATRSVLFIFEVKQDPCASPKNTQKVLKSAVDQVLDKNYALGDIAAPDHECYVVGLVFSTTHRLAEAFQVQKLAVTNNKIQRDGTDQKVVYLIKTTSSTGRGVKRTSQQVKQEEKHSRQRS